MLAGETRDPKHTCKRRASACERTHVRTRVHAHTPKRQTNDAPVGHALFPRQHSVDTPLGVITQRLAAAQLRLNCWLRQHPLAPKSALSGDALGGYGVLTAERTEARGRNAASARPLAHEELAASCARGPQMAHGRCLGSIPPPLHQRGERLPQPTEHPTATAA